MVGQHRFTDGTQVLVRVGQRRRGCLRRDGEGNETIRIVWDGRPGPEGQQRHQNAAEECVGSVPNSTPEAPSLFTRAQLHGRQECPLTTPSTKQEGRYRSVTSRSGQIQAPALLLGNCPLPCRLNTRLDAPQSRPGNCAAESRAYSENTAQFLGFVLAANCGPTQLKYPHFCPFNPL